MNESVYYYFKSYISEIIMCIPKCKNNVVILIIILTTCQVVIAWEL